MMSDEFVPEVVDPKREWAIVQRKLPHWSQSGVLCFITFRTYDSIPNNVLKAWHAERANWLAAHGIDGGDWRIGLRTLERSLQREFHARFSLLWHNHLDVGHGACVLQQPELAAIVADSLHHFDGERYLLTDFVVMPNHVHLLAALRDEDAMLDQCESWKHFTARQINAQLGRQGRFWRRDGFDHLLRSEEQFFRVRRYIAENPAKARLLPSQCLHYSMPLSGEPS